MCVCGTRRLIHHQANYLDAHGWECFRFAPVHGVFGRICWVALMSLHAVIIKSDAFQSIFSLILGKYIIKGLAVTVRWL